ncbi:hypothetical protein FOL47_006061 [Perkinsus chesapeaki]|uniref:Uncharacterized protein n=1 Tax=Perkinsus chesapeaki TaxID=330153 RepID=A0A7J6LTY3_PERCH|nr:hypothetical protein FOL47_006061 [Perkinsus chesapeaki]
MDLDPSQVRSLLIRQDEWTSGVMFDADTGSSREKSSGSCSGRTSNARVDRKIIASTAPLPGEMVDSTNGTAAETTVASSSTSSGSVSAIDYSHLADNVKGMIKAYSPADKGQAVLADGLNWLGMHFDIHAFYPPLLYGRESAPAEQDDSHDMPSSLSVESTVGLAACNGLRNEVPIILVITYSLPVLSSRAVPQMIRFFREHIGYLPDWSEAK